MVVRRGSVQTSGSGGLAGLAAGLSVVPVGAQLDLQHQGTVSCGLVPAGVLQQDGRGQRCCWNNTGTRKQVRPNN